MSTHVDVWGNSPELGWFDVIDHGVTLGALTACPDVMADDTRVAVGQYAPADWGSPSTTNQVNYYCANFDLKGTLQNEFLLGVSGSDEQITPRSDSLGPGLFLNPNDDGNMIMTGFIQNAAETYDTWFVLNVDETGTIDHIIDAGVLTGTANSDVLGFEGSGVCSNGDVWVHSVNDPDQGRVALYDRSGSYLSTILTTRMDAFGTYDWFINEGSDYRSTMGIVLSDDSFVVFGCTGDNIAATGDARAVLGKITTGGTVTATEFYENVNNGYIIPQALCIDESDNIYVVWHDASSIDDPVVSKFSSSLVHQWSFSVDGFVRDGTPAIALCSMCMSPDDTKLYIINGKEDVADGYGMTLDPSDGSLLQSWKITHSGGTGSEDLINFNAITSNSTQVFIGCISDDSAGNPEGMGLLCVPQRVFDHSRGVTIGTTRRITKSSRTNPTLTTATLTISSPVTTKTAWTPSPSSGTGLVSSLAFDGDPTHDLELKGLYHYY